MAVDFTAIFKAQDKVSKTLDSIDKSGNALGGTFKKLAIAAAGVFSVAKVVEFGKESVNAFTNFENKMNEVFTLLPGISDSAMKEMTAQVDDFSKKMGVLPEETVPALYQALSAGVPKDNVFNFLENANKLAVGGVAKLEDSVGVLSTITNNYKGMGLDTAKASDLLFNTVKNGVTTIPELASAMGNVVPSAASVGVAFEDVSAAMATMTASLGKGSTSVATTKLRSMFDELNKTGSQVDKLFRDVAGKGFREFIKGGGSLEEALQKLNAHAEKNNLTIKELFSSVEAGDAALILGSTSASTFASNLAQMDKASGAADDAYNQMTDGFQYKLNKLNANIAVFKKNVGEKLVNAITFLWDKAEPILKSISQGFEKIKGLFSDFGFSGAIEKLFGADAGKIAKMAEDYATAYVGGIKKIFSGDLKGGFTDILKAMGFDDKSIGAITDFVTSIQDNLMKLVSFVQPIFITIKDAFFSILPTLQNIINFFTQTLLPIFQDVFGFIVNNVITPFVAFWQANFPKLANIFNNVWLILQPIFKALADAFTFVWNIAKPIIDNIIQLITGLASSIWSILDGIIQFIAGVFTGDWQKAWDGVVKIFGGIWEGIVAIFKFPINMLIDGINFFLRSLNSIKIPDWVPLVGGKGLNIPEIPKLAVGSKDAPNTFIAGEKGPELITGAAGARVFPSDETDRIISAFERQSSPLMVSASPFGEDRQSEDPASDEKTINININGEGTIKGKGISKDEILEYLIVHLKPILLSIIETEIFEEGDLAYEF